MNVPLKCRCGTLRGMVTHISPSAGIRIVCLCDDCQAFAHYLGRANEILDANGGTDIFPVTPSNLKITAGIENLKCLRLTDRGLLRWYSGCCKTAIANSVPFPKVPFTGVIHTIMDHSDKPRDEALGPVRARILGKYGIGTLPQGAYQTAPLSIILSTIRFLSVGWMKRQHSPSPYFDPSSGKLKVTPYVLTSAEREQLRKFCGPKPPVT